MRTWQRIAAATILIGCAVTVNATPIVTPDGITGLDVGGVFYDVVIGDQGNQTLGEVYSHYVLLPTNGDPDPELFAVNIAMAALFRSLQIPLDYFNGCESRFTCTVFSPTGADPSGSVIYDHNPVRVNLTTTNIDWFWYNAFPGIGFAATNNISGSDLTYAIVSRQAGSVPTGSSFALFSAGLILLALKRRQPVVRPSLKNL